MKKTLIVLALVCCMLAIILPISTVSAASVTKSGTCGNNLTWKLYSDGELVISGSGDMTNWPSSSDAPWYNYRSSIKTVTVESGVTSIGYGAFFKCDSLTSVDLPDSVTSIGECAFFWCESLTSIDLPDGVTSIGDHAFRECPLLTSIDIPDGVTSIGEEAFHGCTKLTSIDIPDSVTSIGGYAFDNCDSLTNIDIPDSVTSIGYYAFLSCDSLTSIDLPDSVTSIGTAAFRRCTKLTKAVVNNPFATFKNNIFDNVSADFELHGYKGSTAEAYASENGHKFVEIVDLYTVTFKNYDGTVISTAEYEEGATVVVPETPIREADDTYTYEFAGWDKEITTVTGDVEYIAQYTAQRKITASGTCGKNLTWKLYSDGELVISGSGEMNAFSYPNYEPWYDYRSSIKTVTIKAGVTSIGNYAFYYCTKLKSIDLPAGLTSIGNYAFDYCYSLTSIDLPASLTSIGYGAFFKCDSLTSIGIPDSVTSIRDNAFAYCESLTSIDIPNSVTSIGDNAFNSCTSLTKVVVSNPNATFGGSVFYGVPASFELHGYKGSTAEAYASKNGHKFVKIVDYTVVFKNYNGDVISTAKYHYGDTVIVPADPARPADDTFTYIFKGWDKKVAEVTGNVEYTAQYVSVYIDYAIVFKDYNGNVIYSETYHYGEAVDIPADPTRAADDEYTYEFTGWDKEVTAVNGDAVYTATYKAVAIQQYVVGDVNGDEKITKDDAIYILMHTFFEEDYPAKQDFDFNKDGVVTKDDAIYVLMYTFFPEEYPIG